MGKSAAYSKVFVVGRKNGRRIHREITSDPLPEEKHPLISSVVPRGRKRSNKLQRYLQSGLISRSEKTAEDLLKEGIFSVDDCLDEAELRSHFPKNGIGHNFFMGKHRFLFLLANDGVSVVAQIHKTI